jgi:hypothetical protein
MKRVLAFSSFSLGLDLSLSDVLGLGLCIIQPINNGLVDSLLGPLCL